MTPRQLAAQYEKQRRDMRRNAQLAEQNAVGAIRVWRRVPTEPEAERVALPGSTKNEGSKR